MTAAAVALRELLALPGRVWRHYRSYGFRSLYSRARLALGDLAWLIEPSPRNLPAGVVVRRPRAIHGSVEAPRKGHALAEGPLLVSGWAFSRQEVERVELYVDGRPVAEGSTGVFRPDIHLRFKSASQAERSGYAIEVSLEGIDHGTHELIVVARDRAGNSRAFVRTFHYLAPDEAYQRWMRATAPSRAELERLAAAVASRALRVTLWADCDAAGDLRRTVSSIVGQRAGVAWRCLLVTSRPAEAVLASLQGVIPSARRDQLRVVRRGDPVPAEEPVPTLHGFLRAGEELAAHALVTFAAALPGELPAIAYSDRDHVRDDSHVRPVFLPAWSPDLALASDYVGGFYLVRETTALRRWLGDPFPPDQPAWRYRLLLEMAGPGARVVHVPRVLWSQPSSESADARLAEAQRQVVAEVLSARRSAASIDMQPSAATRRLRWPVPADRPTVSMVIPTTGRLELVRPLVESIRRHTAYPSYELVFVDNGRGSHPDGVEYLHGLGMTVLERDEPFNWAKLSNDGARASSGELVLFLNDDIEALDDGWLDELVGHAVRPDVGAVGAMLLYPEGTIQHAGVFLVDRGGGARHYFQRQKADAPAYLDLHRVAREVSAVTGACLLVGRSRFEELGGFDERLPIAGNDVDFCLRLRAHGYRNMWTPHSRLIHHESVSRAGHRVDLDEALFRQRWSAVLAVGDPYHNPNLAQDRSDCTLDLTLGQRGDPLLERENSVLIRS